MKDLEIKKLSENISYLTSLKKLNLNGNISYIIDNQIGNEGIKCLSKKFLYLNNLEFLLLESILFLLDNNIRDDGVIELVKNITSITNLVELNLKSIINII